MLAEMQKPQTQPFGDFAAIVISSQGLSPAGCSRHPYTHCSIKSWSQVRDEHLWVDGLEVPGEVLAVELFPQLAPVCNVTIRLLSTKSREKIKLTSEASKEKNNKKKNPLRSQGSELRGPPGFVIIRHSVPRTQTGGGVLQDTLSPQQVPSGWSHSLRGLGHFGITAQHFGVAKKKKN